MIAEKEETVLDKTPVLINPETYVLTHNRYITYSILIFTDIVKAQIYRLPYRHSPHHEIETLLSFICLNLFQQNEDEEHYYKRGPNDKIFIFETEGINYIYVGETLFSFETTDKIVEYSSNDGLDDAKYTYAHGIENIYFMLYRKYIPLEEYKISTQRVEYVHLHKKDDEMKSDNIADENQGVVDYGNDFNNCKFFSA